MWKRLFIYLSLTLFVFCVLCITTSAETIFRDEYISPVSGLTVSNSNSTGAVFKYYGVNTTSGDKNAYIWRSDKAALYSTAYINVPLQSVTSNASISTDISFTIWVPTLKTGATTGSPALSNLDSITFQLSKDTGQVYEYSALSADDATEVIYQETIFSKTYTGYYYKLSRKIPSDVTGFRIYWSLSGSGSSAAGEQATFGISNIHVYQTADNSADLPLYPGYEEEQSKMDDLENEESTLNSQNQQGLTNASQYQQDALTLINQHLNGFHVMSTAVNRITNGVPLLGSIITVAVYIGLFALLLGFIGSLISRRS